MKKIIGIPFVVSILLVACNNNTSENKTPATDTTKHDSHTMMPPPAEKKFAGVAFANQQDYICGMPVTAGVEDTAVYKTKVYGFCSKECKEEFLKNPEQYLTVKK